MVEWWLLGHGHSDDLISEPMNGSRSQRGRVRQSIAADAAMPRCCDPHESFFNHSSTIIGPFFNHSWTIINPLLNHCWTLISPVFIYQLTNFHQLSLSSILNQHHSQPAKHCYYHFQIITSYQQGHQPASHDQPGLAGKCWSPAPLHVDTRAT